MAIKEGRALSKDEVVHHINELHNDNRLENLVILTSKEHSRLHGDKYREAFQNLKNLK